ncbi:MAG: hypothetical protein H7Y00_12125 [Fimbriimonadaceae bacterium]|nr:hypothetical protein [Chitinophagales bacterium]
MKFLFSIKNNFCCALRLTRCSIIYIFILFGFHSFAQNSDNHKIQFHQFSTEHGISQNCFWHIIQDKKGYMWFGTTNGVLKFDGYDFTIFQTDPENKNALPDSWLYEMCSDTEGNIWFIGSETGLFKCDTYTEKFISFHHDKNDKYSIPSDCISCITTDKKGGLWIATCDGDLCRYDAATKHFINYSENNMLPDTLCSKTIYSLLLDHNGLLWIGTNKGVNVFDPVHKTLIAYKPGDENNFAQYCSGNYLFEDHAGNIWMSFVNGGVKYLDPSTGIVRHYVHDDNELHSISSNNIGKIYEDHKNNIWIATYNAGLNLWQPETNNFSVFKADAEDENALSGNNVSTIYEDNSGILWIGMNGGGLNTVDLNDKNFDIYRKEYDNDYATNFPVSMYKDHEGKIWIATFGAGIRSFDPITKKFNSFLFENNKVDNKGFNLSMVVFEDSNNTIWAGTLSEGLHALNQETGIFKTFHSISDNADSTIFNQINCIAEDNNERLWLGTSVGLKCFDLKTNKYVGFNDIYTDTNQLSSDDISSLYFDDDGVLWIGGTSGGLTLFSPASNTVKIYKQDDKNPNSISSDAITCFFDDEKGKVWIGTDNGGLNEFDKLSQKFSSFTTKNGLPGNSVRGILSDDNGNLWFSTNNGICKFTPPSGGNNNAVCRNYSINDGLPGDEYFYNTCAKGDGGTLYFGSYTGIVSFKPNELTTNQFITPVLITDFQIFNKSIVSNDSSGILQMPIDETDEIILSHKQNVFSFTFSALSYVHPEKNQFAYMLEGFDKDWIYTTASKRFATYTNLDAGKYIFKVKASNNDGIWNETPAAIKITITPPYWQTWWFISLCGIAGTLLLYSFYNYRMQKKRDISRIRNRIASDLHDDLGATLSSISIMSEIVQQQIKNELPQAIPMLEKIGLSSRNMIENVNDMVWAINPKNDSFENIIKRMRTFASEILSAKDIAFNLDFDKNLLDSKLKMDTRRNFYLIFKEAINNIAKYSEAMNAFVFLKNNEDNLMMIIRDDGKGFEINTVEKGNGLVNMQLRAEEMKAKFNLASTPGKGTVIELELKNAAL